MTDVRTIEVFTAGCPLCREAIRALREEACDSCEVEVVDLRDPDGERRARALGVTRVPSVAMQGKLAFCCEGESPDLDVLREAGLGKPLS